MRRAVFPALVALLTVGSVTAQRPITPPPQRPIPEPTTRQKPTQHKITVRGCVENGRLRIPRWATDVPFEILNVSEFILEGPKELLRQIQDQHNRHEVEIDGVATVPPSSDGSDAAVETSKKGKVRIVAGRRDEKGKGPQGAPQQIKLRVASVTHLSESCVAQ